MKITPPQSDIARAMLALFLGVIGILAFFVSLLLMFGWLISEGPAPGVGHKLVTGLVGLIIFASSISCFVLASRSLRSALPDENEKH
jgi:hypothetical protein